MRISTFMFICFLMIGCTGEQAVTEEPSITTLEKIETIVDIESNILAVPNVIKLSGQSDLFVYDLINNQVFHLNENGDLNNEIGESGRGPGEYLSIGNIFIENNSIYIIDIAQLIIQQYDIEGNHVSSFNFGDKTSPSAPPSGRGPVAANDIDNQPYVTSEGNVILSNAGGTGTFIFQIIDWENDQIISEVGEIPEGGTFILNNEELRAEALRGEVPSFYKVNSFPVQDRSNPDEYFIVYSSLSKVAKYNSTSDKLWEKEIITPETESIREHFFETMDGKRSDPIRERVGLKFYTSGVSNEQGDLFLVSNINPVVIHQLNNKGEFIHKYQFDSEEVSSLLEMDFSNNRIFAASENGEIEVYSFGN